MGLSAPGVGSNLDVNSLVSQLMAIERQPLALVQKREAAVQAQLSAFGMLQSQIASFGDASSALAKAGALAAFKASVGDTEVASASVSGATAAGSYSLEVKQLAQVGKLATGAFASSSTVVGTGTITITLGTYDGTANTFSARSDKTPLVVNIDSSNNTLAGVRDAINAAKGGVTASIVSDSAGARLVVTSSETGVKNAIKIDSPAIAAFAYDPVVLTPQSVSKLQSAQDAKLVLDGIDLVSSSNQITGAIEGMTLNLAKAKPGQTTTVNVSQDSAAPAAALKTFINAYNALNAMARSYTKYDAASKVKGALQGEVTAVTVVNQMRSTITGVLPSVAGDYTRLNDIGISLQQDGSLKLDETKLSTAISTASGFASVAGMFVSSTTSTDTFATRIKAFVDKMQGTNGLIPSKTDGLSTSIKRLDREQEAINARLIGVEARLRKQFNALDAQLSSQNAVSAYLTSQVTIWNNNTSSSKT